MLIYYTSFHDQTFIPYKPFVSKYATNMLPKHVSRQNDSWYSRKTTFIHTVVESNEKMNEILHNDFIEKLCGQTSIY